MKTILPFLACLLIFPAVLAANPVQTTYFSEFSTDEDWIEIYCYWYEIRIEKGMTFTVNSDTVTVTEDIEVMPNDNRHILLNQENTTGFDLPAEGAEIRSGDFYLRMQYGPGQYCPAPPEGASAAFHLVEPPAGSEGSPQSYWSLDFSPTPGEDNDHEMAACGDGTVIINEFCPGREEAGDAPFVELFNNGDEAVDIGGWLLASAKTCEIPSGTVIDPGDFCLIDSGLLPEEFFALPDSGSVFLANGSEALLDRAYWSMAPESGETLMRYPDGFVAGFSGYRSYLSLDFRAGECSPGTANKDIYAIESLVCESDSLFVSPGRLSRACCLATDSSGRTFRIKADWSLDSDCVSVDDTGLLTFQGSGDGVLTASYGGFSDTMKIHCAIGGTINHDLTLKAADSPHIFESSVIVEKGATLTIEPGCEIKGNSYFSLWCYGRIVAEGTAAAPIVFTTAWDASIEVRIYGDPCVLKHCDFSANPTRLLVSTSNSQWPDSVNEIHHCTFMVYEYGMPLNSDASVTHCLFKGYEVKISGCENIEFRNNILLGRNRALSVGGLNNSGGTGSEPGVRIVNNIFYHSNEAIFVASGLTPDIHHNAFCYVATSFTGLPDEYGAETETNANGYDCDKYFNITCNPMLAGVRYGDYSLLAGSPCIDAGDPALMDADGTVSDIGLFGGEFTVDVAETDQRPAQFSLAQNSPNPFNPATSIRFTLPTPSRVLVTVHNITGQRVATLLDGARSAGSHSLVWDAADMPSGIYFCTVSAGNHRATRKMLLLK